jgi:hypothetical protein
MKTLRPRTGPFAERPYFETDEIEALCARELHKQGLLPADPQPIRIDRFIEKRFGIQPSYEDLPPGLLGFTRFGAGGVQQIVVSKALDDAGTTTAERRLRTTLAHEGGHGLLHAHLFALGASPGALFGDGLDADAPKILCRDEASGEQAAAGRANYRWWEYQANQVMAALLLPKALVKKAVAPHLCQEGNLGLSILPADRREDVARLLAEVFDVNPVVVRIRLDALYPSAAGGQLTL